MKSALLLARSTLRQFRDRRGNRATKYTVFSRRSADEVVLTPILRHPEIYDRVILEADLSTRPRPRIRAPQPQYPHELRMRGISGRVVIAYIVDAAGLVSDLRVIETTDSRFAESVMASVIKWKFDPGMLNEMPTRCLAVVEFTFERDPD